MVGGVAVNTKTLKIFTALLVINTYAGTSFLTRALEIKLKCGWFFEVFFIEVRHTLGSGANRYVQIKKNSASVDAGAA